MHRRPLLLIMILSVAAVLAISLAVLQDGRTSILRDFQASQAKLAQQASGDLRAYLDSFDRDTRLAAALAERTRGQATIDRSAQDQVIQAAFAAQVTVVEHYRTIALFGAPEAPPIVAIDPTEDPMTVAPALVAASGDVAREVINQRHTVFRGPVTVGVRSFYFYGAPVGAREAAVVSADAVLMLQVAGRGRGGSQTMIVVDPNHAVWLGCEARRTCRLYVPGSPEQLRVAELMRPVAASRGRSPAPPLALPLPGRAVVGTAPPVSTPLGAWSVALAASAAELDEFQERLMRQTLLTSIAVVVAMLVVGFFIVRQRSNAAALETRLQSAQEIANLRERSERILENVPAGILGVTPDGRLTMTNRFFSERIQPHHSAGNAGPPAWTRRLRAHVERALASRRTQIVTDPDVGLGDELRDYDVRIVPLDRPADDVAALVLIEDLSELHDLQRQLVRAEKLVTVGVLSAGIAHELGTPLAVIRGRAEHLLERCADQPTDEALRAIIAQIDHISSTIRRILEFCRTEPMEGGVADAREVTQRAVKLLEWRLAGKQVDVKVRIPAGLPPIAADPKQFEQMMINLLMNAYDASPEGAVIELSGEVDPNHPHRLRLEVIDHGTGIAPEHINAAFDPYFTTKKRGEGTGLGLAIVAHIARLHLAEVSLASTPGAGTTATILWPVAQAEVVALA